MSDIFSDSEGYAVKCGCLIILAGIVAGAITGMGIRALFIQNGSPLVFAIVGGIVGLLVSRQYLAKL